MVNYWLVAEIGDRTSHADNCLINCQLFLQKKARWSNPVRFGDYHGEIASG